MKGISNKIIEDFKEIYTFANFIAECEEDKQLHSKAIKIKKLCEKYMGVD